MADEAGAGRRLGVELRRLRLAAGLSIAELARRTHYSKGHISKVETGLKPPSPEFVRAMDSAVQAAGQLIALATVRPKSDRVASGVEPEAGSHAWAAESGGVEAGADAGAPAAAVGFEGDASLEAFRSALGSLRDLGQVLDPASVVEMVKPYILVLRQLAQSAEPAVRSDVSLLGSRFAEFAGWMAQEMGDDVAALRWTDEAAELARAAGDRDLIAYANVRRANIALYQQDAYGTIAFSQQAQAMECSDRIKGLAAQREAQGHALVGNYDAFRRCISLSARLLSHSAGSATGELVLGSVRIPDTVALAEGWSLHDLGRSAEAAEILTALLERTPGRSMRARARIGARLALALASIREIDRASKIIQPMLEQGNASRSATVRADLRQLARVLNRWSADPAVRRIMPELSAALTPVSSGQPAAFRRPSGE